MLLTRSPLYSSSPACAGPDFLVRLACVRHAASVDSEPGSNSRLKLGRRASRLPAACTRILWISPPHLIGEEKTFVLLLAVGAERLAQLGTPSLRTLCLDVACSTQLSKSDLVPVFRDPHQGQGRQPTSKPPFRLFRCRLLCRMCPPQSNSQDYTQISSLSRAPVVWTCLGASYPPVELKYFSETRRRELTALLGGEEGSRQPGASQRR